MSFAIAKKPSTNKTHQKKRHVADSTLKGPHTTPVSIIQPKAICACGGGCPRCKDTLGIQTKLRIGEPGDKYEQEANRIADMVMRMPAPQVQRQEVEETGEEEEVIQTQPITEQITPLVQRQEAEETEEEELIQTKPQMTPLVQRQVEPEEEEDENLIQTTPQITPLAQLQVEEEEPLQGKANPGNSPEVTPSIELTTTRIQSPRGSGQPLPESTCAFFEPRFGHDFSHIRVHTDAKAAESARAINAQAYTLGRDIVFDAGQYASTTDSGKKLLAHELTHVIQQSGRSTPSDIQRKVDFEFDLNYGTENKGPPNATKENGAREWSKTPITTHRRKDSSGKMQDGFKVVQDGNRIEITTMRFRIGRKGRRDLTNTMRNITGFVGQLKAGCDANTSPPRVRQPAGSASITEKNLGRPRYFKPGFSEPPDRVFFPLGRSKKAPYFDRKCDVFAAPQATLDVPLGGVDELVSEIAKSAEIEEWEKFKRSAKLKRLSKAQKKRLRRQRRREMAGVALTGSKEFGTRPGSRSDALFEAQKAVNKTRMALLKAKVTLSDGTPVTKSNFTDNLQGFMILLVSYLRTSEIAYASGDYERFAKAYPPIVTHTRFIDMYHRILTKEERQVFEELFGNSAARSHLYALAGRRHGGGLRNLFPGPDKLKTTRADPTGERVQEFMEEAFGRRFTWDDFVTMILSDTKLPKVGGEEVTITPLAKATKGPTRAGPKKAPKRGLISRGIRRFFGIRDKRRREEIGTRLEMRRIGFTWVPFNRLKGLTDKVFDLARRLNS